MNKRVVLVVDDETLTREVVGALLESEEVEVHFAASGSQAVEVARKTRPDVVLLDVVMPDLDGFEVCRLLRHDAATARSRIVILSANDDNAARSAAAEAGADAYLTKPYGVRDLFGVVEGDLPDAT